MFTVISCLSLPLSIRLKDSNLCPYVLSISPIVYNRETGVGNHHWPSSRFTTFLRYRLKHLLKKRGSQIIFVLIPKWTRHAIQFLLSCELLHGRVNARENSCWTSQIANFLADFTNFDKKKQKNKLVDNAVYHYLTLSVFMSISNDYLSSPRKLNQPIGHFLPSHHFWSTLPLPSSAANSKTQLESSPNLIMHN